VKYTLILVAFIAGCATAKPFVTGDVVPTPYGCMEARQRGTDC